mmetsp:Transcript_50217/g.143593  ORF Transcript_50217/g.143593 Transcript_50217/m.143593 type:complete len:213 (-) Transcript_50217:541-1179(-)
MRTSWCSEAAGRSASLFASPPTGTTVAAAAEAEAADEARQLSACRKSLSACLKACCTELPWTSEWQRLCRKTDAPVSTSSLPASRSMVTTCGTPASRNLAAAACGCGAWSTTSWKRAAPSLGDGAPVAASLSAGPWSPPTKNFSGPLEGRLREPAAPPPSCRISSGSNGSASPVSVSRSHWPLGSVWPLKMRTQQDWCRMAQLRVRTVAYTC